MYTRTASHISVNSLRQNTRPAFSLTELLISLFIISILVAVPVVARGPIVRNAKTSSFQSSMYTLRDAITGAAALTGNVSSTYPTGPVAPEDFNTWLAAQFGPAKQYLDKDIINPFNTTTNLLVVNNVAQIVNLNDQTPTLAYETFDNFHRYRITWRIYDVDYTITDQTSTMSWTGLPDPIPGGTYLDPATIVVHPGDNFTLEIRASTASQLVNAISVALAFPPAMVEVVSPNGTSGVDTSSGVFTQTYKNVFDNSLGTLQFDGGEGAPGVMGNGLFVATVKFHVLPTCPVGGNISITFTKHVLLRTDLGGDVGTVGIEKKIPVE